MISFELLELVHQSPSKLLSFQGLVSSWVGALEELGRAAAQFTTVVERREKPAWGASHCASATAFAGSE